MTGNFGDEIRPICALGRANTCVQTAAAPLLLPAVPNQHVVREAPPPRAHRPFNRRGLPLAPLGRNYSGRSHGIKTVSMPAAPRPLERKWEALQRIIFFSLRLRGFAPADQELGFHYGKFSLLANPIFIYKVTWGNSATLSGIFSFSFCKCVGTKL